MSQTQGLMNLALARAAVRASLPSVLPIRSVNGRPQTAEATKSAAPAAASPSSSATTGKAYGVGGSAGSSSSRGSRVASY